MSYRLVKLISKATTRKRINVPDIYRQVDGVVYNTKEEAQAEREKICEKKDGKYFKDGFQIIITDEKTKTE